MANDRIVKSSDSNFVRSITLSVASSDGEDLVIPDGLWDVIVVCDKVRTRVFLVGSPLLQPILVPHAKGQKTLVISFKIGVFVSVDFEPEEKGFYTLPLFGKDSFKIGDVILKIPTLESVDSFVKDLLKHDLLVCDEIVRNVAAGGLLSQSDRTSQRHFKKVTGMTPNYYHQVQRAMEAAELLRQGKSALAVAHDLGYYDQFHLSKSLKTILGQSPSDM